MRHVTDRCDRAMADERDETLNSPGEPLILIHFSNLSHGINITGLTLILRSAGVQPTLGFP